MTINNISIKSFGKFNNFSLNFKSNANVVFGPNEAGKSTIFAFFKLMFYSRFCGERSGNLDKEFRSKFFPWNGENMQGSIDFLHNNQKYHLQKDINAETPAKDKIFLHNLSNSKNISLSKKEEIGEYFFNLNLINFEHSCYINNVLSKNLYDGNATSSLTNKILSNFGIENKSRTLIFNRVDEAIRDLKHLRGRGGKIFELEEEIYSFKKAIFEAENAEKERILAEFEFKKIEENISEKKLLQADIENTENAGKLSILKEIFNLKKQMEIYSEKINRSKKLFALKMMTFSVLCSALLFIFSYFLNFNVFIMSIIFIAFLGGFFTFNVFKKNKILTEIKFLSEKISMKKEILGLKKADFNELKVIMNNLEKQKIEPSKIDLDEAKIRLNLLESMHLEEKYYNYMYKINNNYINLPKLKIELKEKIDKLEKMKAHYEALNIVKNAILEASEELENTFRNDFNKSTSEIFSHLTDGEYNKVIIQNNFEILANCNDFLRSYKSLSAGTQDQAYFALRISLCKIFSKNNNLPLFLDDPFIQFDNKRLENVLEFVRNYSDYSKTQVILFTCHKHIYKIAKNIGFDLLELSE